MTIEGHTNIAFTEDVASDSWRTAGTSRRRRRERPRAIERALHTFKAEHDRPTLIVVHSHIGYGSPGRTRPRRTASRSAWRGQGHEAVLRLARGHRTSSSPTGCTTIRRRHRHARREARDAWHTMFEKYRAQNPELADEIERMQRRELPDGLGRRRCRRSPPTRRVSRAATRRARCSTRSRRAMPWVVGGSADLSPSTKTNLTFDGAGDFQAESRGGRNLHLGVREHASAAIANGMALTKLRPVLVRVPDLLRLRAGRDPPLGVDGDPRRAHLHARLDRRRRGRPDASAGRAARVAARDAGAARVPSR